MAKNLDAASNIAIHRQLYAILHEAIETGALVAGQRLPSERALAAEYGISRATVRQALHQLVREGLIYSRPGSGFYVAAPHAVSQLHLRDFSEQMGLNGLPHTTQILEQRNIRADAHLAQNLDLIEGERVTVFQYLHSIYYTPIGIEWAYLSAALFPDLLQLAPLSLCQTLEAHYGTHLAYGIQTVQARLASADECAWLQADLPLAVLTFQRRIFDAHQKVVLYSVSLFRCENFSLSMILYRK